MWYRFRPYVPVAVRRARAQREVEKRKKKGHTVAPVVIEGRAIAATFWGKAWCDNLESYSDFANRLPRGRTYVRNGSVVDLQIQPDKVMALVSGSELYEIVIKITALPGKHWRAIKTRCAGEIGSLVELLQGRLAKGVMDVVTARDDGLFPRPSEIKMSCSCPDWAGMCKHVAAALYGVGARLDRQPELLFVLREVDHLELIEEAVPSAGAGSSSGRKTLVESEVSSVFGIELAKPEGGAAAAATTGPGAKTGRRAAPAPRKPPRGRSVELATWRGNDAGPTDAAPAQSRKAKPGRKRPAEPRPT
jgi:uncharacterized Zn finger protein